MLFAYTALYKSSATYATFLFSGWILFYFPGFCVVSARHRGRCCCGELLCAEMKKAHSAEWAFKCFRNTNYRLSVTTNTVIFIQTDSGLSGLLLECFDKLVDCFE